MKDSHLALAASALVVIVAASLAPGQKAMSAAPPAPGGSARPNPSASAQTLPGPASAVVEDVLGEIDAGNRADDGENVVSADSRKAAWRAQRRDRWVVMLNGDAQAGEFDEVRQLDFGGTGEHLAFMAREGKAWFVVLDGKPASQRFDKLGELAFSYDGQRLAYTGRRDKKWFAVVDGAAADTSYEEVGSPEFSRDGKRLAFSAKRGGKWGVIADGKDSGQLFDALGNVVFSPDGQRLACVGVRGGKQMVVLDGQEGPPYGTVTGLTFSRDSRHFGYVGVDRVTGWLGDKGRGQVVIDGKAGPVFEGVSVSLANPPTGLDLSYADRVLTRMYGVSRPAFSPDGTKAAYAARRGKDDEVVIVDGQPGTRFPSIVGGPLFSGDGRYLAFAASDGDSITLIVDGQRVGNACLAGTDFVSAMTFGFDSRRVAYVGVTGGNMYKKGVSPRAKRCIYVDGKPGRQYDALRISGLQFSLDSGHTAYAVQNVEEGSQHVSFVVVDDIEGKRYDTVYGFTLVALDVGKVVYAARSGRKFVRVTQSIQ